MTESPTFDPGPAHHHRPTWAPLTLVGFVGLVVCSNFATAYAAKWVNTNPVQLLALSSRVRHLFLVAGRIDWWEYVGVAGVRLATGYVVCHLVGRAYGEDVLRWFGKYLGVSAEGIRSALAKFDKADWIVVPWFAGSNIVAAITGIRKMHPLRLAVLLSIGILGRLALYWWLADVFDDQRDDVLDFLSRYQRPALIVSIVLAIVVIGVNLRRGRNFEL